MKIRRGKWDFPGDRKNFKMMGAINYNGVLISNFLVGFIIVLLILSLVFIILSYNLIWELLYENIWVIVVLAAPVVAQAIITAVLQGSIVQDAYVSRRL